MCGRILPRKFGIISLARKQVQVHDVIKCMHTLQPMMRTSTGRAEDMVPDDAARQQ